MFDQPANLFVAGFIGSPQMNFFDGELEKKDGKYQLKVGEATVVLGGKAQELLTGKGVGERKVTVASVPSTSPLPLPLAAIPCPARWTCRDDGQRGVPARQRRGPRRGAAHPHHRPAAEHRAGIPYGTEINFAFRPDLIHLFDPETEKNLMY